MQGMVRRILEEKFDFEYGSLDFSCNKIEFALPEGSSCEGSFYISSDSGKLIRGEISSSDLRMECDVSAFSGNEVEIRYHFRGEHTVAGDIVRGTFSIVSNHGEYYLPYEISIERALLHSSQGDLENLEQFAEFARNNWQEAVKLFYSAEFVRIFSACDARELLGYRALSVYPGNEQNMEEFLQQTGQKEKVSFWVEENEIRSRIPGTEQFNAVTEASVNVLRSGWGYTAVQVDCRGDFFYTEKEYLTDDDFLGNYCRLPVYIDNSRCRQGNHFGKIILSDPYMTMEIPVIVSCENGEVSRQTQPAARKMLVQLLECYQSFRLKKVSTAVWLQETGKLVERLVAIEENDPAARLFQAQLLITGDRVNEANWILNHVAEILEKENQFDSPLWAYYLYLTTLLPHEEGYVYEIEEEVSLIYRKDRTQWRTAWLLLYLSEEYHKSDSGKWNFLEKQFRYGCSSPILYLEAVQLLNMNPSVMRRLDDFSIQVLWYGVKHKVITAEVVEQLLYLVGKLREYSPVLERILAALYEEQQDVRILQELCILLIKGAKAGRKYFEWYAKSVEAQLRITNLYEYFMMSADLETLYEVPKTVLIYFMYQNNLDYERSAFIYYYILVHKEEYGELYNSYRPKIQRFVLEQIQKCHMNRWLAGLYQEMLVQDMVTAQSAVCLAWLLFAQQIVVEDHGLWKLLVYHPLYKQPAQYLMQNGKVWASLYSGDSLLVFEDVRGNRFVRNVDFTSEKMLDPQPYVSWILPYVKEVPELDIYGAQENTCELQEERFKRLIANVQVESSLRRSCYMALLHQYYDAEAGEELEALVGQVPMEELSMQERGEVIRYLVLGGDNETAYQHICRYGFTFVDLKVLHQMADALLDGNYPVSERVMSAVAAHIFRLGNCSNTLLQYMIRYFRGRTKDMRDLWKAAVSLGVDAGELCERMLVQMLFSGAAVSEKMAVLQYYLGGCFDPEVKEAVVTALAYEYFGQEKEAEPALFAVIHDMVQQGEHLSRISKLAFLKYYAEHHELLTADVQKVTEAFLGEMMERRIHLNCFKEYRESEILLREIRDKTILEYRTRPGSSPRIRCRLMQENAEPGEETEHYLYEVCPGVYFYEYVLFFGESIHYSILEAADGEEKISASGVLQKKESAEQTVASKYELINQMMISKGLLETDALEKQLQEYCRKEFIGDELFVLRTE